MVANQQIKTTLSLQEIDPINIRLLPPSLLLLGLRKQTTPNLGSSRSLNEFFSNSQPALILRLTKHSTIVRSVPRKSVLTNSELVTLKNRSLEK